MKKILLITISAVFLTGCLTLPKQIDEVYLSETTEEESAKLDKIGAEIIARKREKDKTEFDLEIANQRIATAKKEVAIAELNGELLLEKEKLFTLTNESEKLSQTKEQLQTNRVNLTRESAYLKYLNAKRKETEALVDIRTTELAVKVAELDYEKALIAVKYQNKRKEEFKEKDMIDELKNKKLLEDQKIKLDETKKKYDKAKSESDKAMEELKKTGYEVK